MHGREVVKKRKTPAAMQPGSGMLLGCHQTVHKLIGGSCGAAAPSQGKTLGKDIQFRLLHLDAPFPGQMVDDIQISLLIRLLEGDLNAEPLRQGDHFLHGVVAVDVIALPTGEGLLHQMAAVGGGIDHHIPGLGGNAALQDGLQGAEIIVILLEGKIVDKENELQRIPVQLI